MYQVEENVKLVVFDMAGTTVDEGGLVYKTLVSTIKSYQIPMEDEEIKNWYGVNKTQVLKYFLKTLHRREYIHPQGLSTNFHMNPQNKIKTA